MSSSERSRINWDAGRQGFVYVLSSSYLRAEDGTPLLKVGCTRKHPLQRAKELAAGTGVPDAFKIEYYHDFADCFAAEGMVHERFAACRLREQREFFAVPLSEVISFIAGLCNSSTYRELASQGVTGGDYVTQVRLPPMPFADLFATFDPNGPPELTAEEQRKCRALEASLR